VRLSYLAEWALAFGLTQLIEVPVVTALTRNLAAPAWRRAALAFFATLATHPIVWFVMPELGMSEPMRYVASEGWAFGAELVFYRVAMPGATWGVAALASGLANGASFAAGLLAYRVLG
jgi:hypothetical protein